jgi:hypothetical protein
LAGRSVPLVAERLTTLRAERLEVTLHPSDLILSGPDGDVMRARARLAERLAFSKLYTTWTSEGQRLEDRLRRLRWRSQTGAGLWDGGQEGLFRALERDLKAAEVPYEEWEVLFRKLLLLERHLAGLDGLNGHPPRADRRGSDRRTIAS